MAELVDRLGGIAGTPAQGGPAPTKRPAIPFTVKTAGAMAVLYVTLGLLAETQAADLAAALAWAIAVGVGLMYGPAAVAEVNGMLGYRWNGSKWIPA